MKISWQVHCDGVNYDENAEQPEKQYLRLASPIFGNIITIMLLTLVVPATAGGIAVAAHGKNMFSYIQKNQPQQDHVRSISD